MEGARGANDPRGPSRWAPAGPMPAKRAHSHAREAGTHNKDKRLFIPEALVIFGTGPGNRAIIKEAIKLQIPLVGVLDTDSNPSGVRFPIFGNVASYDAIDLYTKLLLGVFTNSQGTQVRDVVASNLAAPPSGAPLKGGPRGRGVGISGAPVAGMVTPVQRGAASGGPPCLN